MSIMIYLNVKFSDVGSYNQSIHFREKLKVTQFGNCFPDYNGSNEYEDTIEFIQRKFNNLYYNAVMSRQKDISLGKEKSNTNEILEISNLFELQTSEDFTSTGESASCYDRALYIHKTCATDEQQMHCLSDVISDVILSSYFNILFV